MGLERPARSVRRCQLAWGIQHSSYALSTALCKIFWSCVNFFRQLYIWGLESWPDCRTRFAEIKTSVSKSGY